MSHHGHEDAMNKFYAEQTRKEQLASAVKLIQTIASDVNGVRLYAGLCDRWLENNGYECEATRRRARERRADELDRELAKLQAERAALK